jgi:hypothetical protein
MWLSPGHHRRQRRRWTRERLMNILTAVLLVEAISLLSQLEPLRPPKRPAQPFRILVFSEPTGEPAAVARVREAERECRKVLKRRKDWFVTTNDRQQAEIWMEIKASWIDEWMSTETRMSNTTVNITRQHYYLVAEVTILGGQFGLRADDRRSLKGAAGKLMDALEEFCKRNYWEILQRRDDHSPIAELSWPHNLRIERTWPFSSSAEPE